MRQGIIDLHVRRLLDHHRYLTLVITTITPGTIIINNHIPSAELQRLLLICFLQMLISILVSSSSNTYTSPLQLHSLMVLIYFRPPVRHPILISHSRHPITTNVRSHLVWAISVEHHRVRDLIAERNCGELWVRKEHLRHLGG